MKKDFFFLFQVGGEHHPLLHSLLETHQMVVISAGGSEPGFNRKAERKAHVDIPSPT